MSAQQTSEIDAINLQAKDTLQQAADMMKGASMMMTMSAVGLGVSSMMGAYQLGGISNASRAGDEADMQSMDEGNATLNKSSQDSLDDTGIATNPATQTKETTATAERSIKQMENSTKEQQAKGIISDDQAKSFNDQAANSKKALEQSQYQTEGTKNVSKTGIPYKNTDAYKQANTDATAAGKGPIDTPEQAVAFYNKQARSLHTDRPQGNIYAQMAKQGIKPGQTISTEQAKASIKSSWNADQTKQYNDAVDNNDADTQSAMLDKPAATFQRNVQNLTINKNSSAWRTGYENASQKMQVYAGMGNALTNLFSQGASNMADQMYQAYGTEQQAAAQVQQSNIQFMGQGVSQTQDIANQLRQEQTSVAQDMQSMVGSTKV